MKLALIKYPFGGGGGGGGTGTTSADNGVSLGPLGAVVLGQNVGQAGSPASLLNSREIPLNGFALTLLPGGGNTNFLSVDSSQAAMWDYYKGTTGQQPLQLITIQGQNPGSNPYGNFWWTLNEALLNPDGQLDAVWQWGYNQDGGGGRRNANEAACWWTMESHFEVGGGTQFEIELATVSRTGVANRHLQIDISKTTGQAQGIWGVDSWTFAPTNTAFANPYFILQGVSGGAILSGNSPSFSMQNTDSTQGQFSVSSNSDGSINISNQSTGANNTIHYSNAIIINNLNGALPSIEINLINSSGIEGFYAQGTVTGYCFPFQAIISATSAVYSELRNIGTGDSYFFSVVAVGGGNCGAIFTTADGSGQWTVGLNQSDSDKFKIAQGSNVNGTNFLTFIPTGQGGFGGITSPTAIVHIGASPGTVGMAPLKITSGPLLAITENGAIESDGSLLYWTNSGLSRFSLNQLSNSFSQSASGLTNVIVSIGTTLLNNTYKVNITPTNVLSSTIFYISAKTTTTFTVTYTTPVTGTISFDWSLFP